MARRTPLTSLKQISEINLTPLMDLTFILLITFIITFPLIEQGIMIQLPQAEGAELTSEQATTITVDQTGKLYLDDVPISLEGLSIRMAALGAHNPEVGVFVRADERIRYGVVVDVLKILRSANLTRMALVTQTEE